MKKSLLLSAMFLGAAMLFPSAAQADSPRAFLEDALQGDNSEIMLGRLAAERGRSPGVREFGQTLVDDHSQAREEVVRLGRRFGLRPDREPSPEARETRDHLMGMRGRGFDRAFIRHMIDDHRKDIAAFRDEAREGHGRVSELARNQLPTLRKHLDMARALERDSGPGRGYDRDRDDRDRDYRRDR